MTLVVLGDTGLLTQELFPTGAMLADACNRFNRLICLEMM